jgi:transcriptional regulator with XRE-family HTH domain
MGQDNARTLAQKLDRLFRTVHPRDRGEFTYDEVAGAIQKTGVTISGSYLWLLRSGRRDNPTKKHIEALARFFGVPPSYFFDDDEAARVDKELDLLMALRDAQVRQIALRAHGLPPEIRQTIQTLVDQLRTAHDKGLSTRSESSAPPSRSAEEESL